MEGENKESFEEAKKSHESGKCQDIVIKRPINNPAIKIGPKVLKPIKEKQARKARDKKEKIWSHAKLLKTEGGKK